MQNKFKKKAGVVIFISVTLVLRAKKSLEKKKEYYIMIEGSMHQEDIMCMIQKIESQDI